MVDPAFREQEARRQGEYLRFDAEHGAAFRRGAPPATQVQQRVLVVSSGSLGLLVEIALVKAIQAAGYRPVILTDYDRWVDLYYRAAGVEEVSYWEEWQRPVSRAEAAAMMNGLGSFEQFIQADYGGARIGKYAASTRPRRGCAICVSAVWICPAPRCARRCCPFSIVPCLPPGRRKRLWQL